MSDSIDISKIFFTFGPEQSCFFHGPQRRCRRGVFRKWDTEAVDTMGQVLCVGMDHDGEAFVVFRQDDGHRRIDMLPGPRSRFSTSFNNTWAWMHEHNDPFSCRFAFGPQIGIMIAWDRTRGPRGTGLPKKPWKAMTKLFEDGHPKHVSFGVGWAYFFLRPDGRWYFKDPEDCYTTLSTYLDARGIGPGDIEFLALNPFHIEEFFLLLKNNTAVFRVPLSYRPDLEDVLREHGVTCQELSSQRTDNTAHLPQKTRNPSMWKAMAGQIARDSAVGSIVAVATSLVGMAACTVM